MSVLEKWHRLVRENDGDAVDALLDPRAVFISPVLHSPQLGREKAAMYLRAALMLLNNGNFRYVGEWRGEDSAVLEFEGAVDGVVINGVDMIWWNAAGLITRFKVMVRPLKGMEMIRGKMAEALRV
jgi:hypothetical protein